MRRSRVFAALVAVCLTAHLSGAEPPRVTRLAAVGIESPTGVATDAAGNVYTVESRLDRLIVSHPDGSFDRQLDGLAKPVAVAVAPDGTLLVANTGRKNVEAFSPTLERLHKLGTGDGEFAKPVALAVDAAGQVYVADAAADRIKVYGPDGVARFTFGGTGSGEGQFSFPTALAVDDLEGELYVADLQIVQGSGATHGGARVQVFDLDGGSLRSFGSYGVDEGQITRPLGIAVDGQSRVYISDAFQNVVLVYDARGTFLTGLYEADRPLRTPLGVSYCRTSSRLWVASLNTDTLEVFGIDDYRVPTVFPEPPPEPSPEPSPGPNPGSGGSSPPPAAGEGGVSGSGGGASCFLQVLR